MESKTKIVIASAVVLAAVGMYFIFRKKPTDPSNPTDPSDPSGLTQGAPTATTTPRKCKYGGKYLRSSKGVVYYISVRADGTCVKMHWATKTKDAAYAWAQSNSNIVSDNELDSIELL
tara:strand:- start:1341 stop:1694 length:354 start_codon:yes stop_codon:yes gene_type:complete